MNDDDVKWDRVRAAYHFWTSVMASEGPQRTWLELTATERVAWMNVERLVRSHYLVDLMDEFRDVD